MLKYKISKHAKERLVERGAHLLKAMVREAYEKGELLNDREMNVMFKKGVYNGAYWQREYRKHFGLIWVFEAKRKAKQTLITVLPLV